MQTPDLFNYTPDTKPEPQPAPEPSTAADKLEVYGRMSLSERELLECIGVKPDAARELLQRCDNTLTQLAKLTAREIQDIKGIGKSTAAAIVAALEIGRRRQTEPALQKNAITCSLDIYDLLSARMRDLTQEVFIIILLDRRSKVLRIEEIHKGGMSAMVVDPKVIFQLALQYKASSLILSHNHPSGATSPSMEDIRLTEKVKMAGNYIDIKVLDHVIIGEGGYYSFADEGKM